MPPRRKLLDPIPPGEILREEFMRPLGININALARALSVPPNRIGAIVNGSRAITADTALRLGRYFGLAGIVARPAVGLRTACRASDDLEDH